MSGGLLEAAAAAGRAREARLRAAGDPRRATLGVVHTPPEVARWAVGRVDALLRARLGVAGGLSDPRVGILDVSVGTGVWLAAALDRIDSHGGAPGGMWGFDFDGGAVEEAARVLAPVAARRGVPLTLRHANTLAQRDPFPAAVPVRVVLGNPPWAARSESREVQPTADWMADFHRDADGAPLNERRSGVLSDDYVRFFRWGAEQARRAPRAVLCLATNSSYLDGPVHRGMRARLSEWFEAIEVLDLGGSARLSRGAEPDENVFGVQSGACVSVLSRGGQPPRAGVLYTRLLGRAFVKRTALDAGVIPDREVPGRGGEPFAPLGQGEAAWPPAALALDAAMPFHREGVQTNRDDFATDRDRDRLLARMRAFAAGGPGPVASGHFDPDRAREALAAALARDPRGEGWIARFAYRPFETRFLVTLGAVSHRPRPALLSAARPDEPCLLTVRKDRGSRPWSLFGACLGPVDGCFLSTRSSCRTRAFPARDAQGRANVDASRVEAWLAGTGVDAARVDGVALIEVALAQLGAASYRARFDGLLRRGYPRLLPPRDAAGFEAARRAGRRILEAFCGGPLAQAVEAGEGALPGVGHFEAGRLLEAAGAEARVRLARLRGALAEAERLACEGARAR